MSNKRNLILLVFSLLILASGLVVGIYLIQRKEPQTIQKEAAVNAGKGKISFELQPAQATHQVGDVFPVTINLKFLGGEATIDTTGFSAAIVYSYGGDSPELTAGSFAADSVLASNGWQCLQDITKDATRKVVKLGLGCLPPLGPDKYLTLQDGMEVASFTLTVNKVPALSPVVLSFDATESFLYERGTGNDILEIAADVGTYAITDAGVGGVNPTLPPAVPTLTVGPISTSAPVPTASSLLPPTIVPTSPPTIVPTSPPAIGGPAAASTPIPTSWAVEALPDTAGSTGATLALFAVALASVWIGLGLVY